MRLRFQINSVSPDTSGDFMRVLLIASDDFPDDHVQTPWGRIELKLDAEKAARFSEGQYIDLTL